MDYNVSWEVDSPDGLEDYALFNYSVIDEPGGRYNDTTYHVRFPSWFEHEQKLGFKNETGVWSNSGLNLYESDTTSPCLAFENGTCNGSNGNGTDAAPFGPHVSPYALWQVIFLAILAASTSFVTILGNLVVVLSFILERTIRQPTNYFIASLAVSDLLIGSLSMPFYTVYLLAGQYWPLGEVLCDLWLSVDYTVCLTSIYTVFCITIDRFCMVKIPAKYRNWRTERKVLIIISCTWLIPVLVFFTSIFGWQYFVGKRTVPKGKCFVQYMEDALFNCILQVGYFWTTLTVMCVLYTGIYKVALDLQKKSEAKHKKMTSLVSMAGQTMTKIGIGMSQQHQRTDAKKLFSEHNNTLSAKAYQDNNTNTPNLQGTSTTSFSSGKNCDKDEERSSSPVFPSDTEPSSQSPKRSPKAKREHKTRKIKHKKRSSTVIDVPKITAPPTGKKNKGNKSKIGSKVKPNQTADTEKRLGQNKGANSSKRQARVLSMPEIEIVQPKNNGGHKDATSPVYDNPTMVNDDSPDGGHLANGSNESNMPMPASGAATAISAPPEMLTGVHYIDQESLKSLQSSDNIMLLVEKTRVNQPAEINEEPESPVWKKRLPCDERSKGRAISGNSSDIEHNADNSTFESQIPLNCVISDMAKTRTGTNIPVQKSGFILGRSSKDVECDAAIGPTAPAKEESLKYDKKIPLQNETKEEIQSYCAKAKAGGTSIKKEKKGGIHVTNLVKSVRRSKKNKNKKEKTQKSRTENRARKALRTITIILGAFVLCWTPWHILSMIIGFCTSGCVEATLYDISYWLCYLNSPINPLCYAFANQQFKKTFIRIMRLDWHKT